MRVFISTCLLAIVLSVPVVAQEKPARHGMAANINNDADFVHMMLMHHEQGIDMAKLAASKAQRAEVRQVAEKILKGQQQESAELQSLKPGGQTTHGASKSHDMGAMPGMRKHQEHIEHLKKATGGEVDRMFLTGMTDHHQMAIDMAVAA